MRERGRLLERHPGRHRREGLLRRADVLCKGALTEGEQVGEDLVTRLESGHIGPCGFDDTGHVQPEATVPRPAQPVEQADELPSRTQAVEVGRG